jgi:hypothetical protein
MHSMLYIPPLPVSFPLLLLAMEQKKNKLEHKFQPQKKNIILTVGLSTTASAEKILVIGSIIQSIYYFKA